jgi:hypothetical protein
LLEKDCADAILGFVLIVPLRRGAFEGFARVAQEI